MNIECRQVRSSTTAIVCLFGSYRFRFPFFQLLVSLSQMSIGMSQQVSKLVAALQSLEDMPTEAL